MAEPSRHTRWRYWTTLNAGLFLAGVTCVAVSLSRVSEGTEPQSTRLARQSVRPPVTLYAFDHQRQIYSFLERSLGTSRQIDQDVRGYVGELYFTGRELTLLENDVYSGVLLDLGRDVQPDSEFSVYYGLRVYKKRFQLRRFPFQDRFVSYDGIDRHVVFGQPTDEHLSVGISPGHTYLLRLAHRTLVGDENLYLLRVLEHTPGVSVTFVWRSVAMLSSVSEAR